MNIDKVTGIFYISGGKINVDNIRNDEVEVTDPIQKLLILKNVIDQNLDNFEKEFQKEFLKLPKIPNQWDIEDMIKSIEEEKKSEY